ncbi:methyltransferase domain-containing protein [Maribacter algicola]|uniref:Methyltransferase domain-containing protein n=1 Tax=Maribacter algicola TaxID=2498892 RepID=A0A426RMJ9_9FLAO|nr:methyltransferase domain-containing protein [Maribacter algicola]RRQ50223.1 methyltransferase domain-containing protein [Maribacter algicola]
MKVAYDKYYETENLFGNPYPELIEFFSDYSERGKILDLGCGQGRDAIPLARLGYNVTGIDNSKVGIEQMNRIAENESLKFIGKVTDIFEFDSFGEFDFKLLDSMFHFAKNDRKKEIDFIKKILLNIKKGCLVVFCVQDTGKKIEILNETIDFEKQLNRLSDKKFEYIFEDKENGHKLKTDYRMVVVEK